MPNTVTLFESYQAYWLDAFKKALAKRGLPRKIYVDNGAAFRSKHFETVAASLGIALIRSSQGHIISAEG